MATRDKNKINSLAGTNIESLGSDLEKKIRAEAGKGEPAWQTAGKKEGVEVWRIEKFHVKPVPVETYGSFYNGDSYIVLKTFKKGNALRWDIHFWLGQETTTDEAGTAAYKTVELDDFLGGMPVQYREVQGFESKSFLDIFGGNIRIMVGGIESGFNHVKPTEYRPRLLQIKGKKHVRSSEVPLKRESLNQGDVFILDNGLTIYQWVGSKANIQERGSGTKIANAIRSERKSQPKIILLEETDKEPDFWKLLGGEGPIKSAEEGGDDMKVHSCEKVLYHLSDASGKMVFKEIAKGANVKRNLLKSEDVFVLDTGAEVYSWVGNKTSKDEKKMALQYAYDYLKNNNRPVYTPVVKIYEGGENDIFESYLK